MEQLLIVLIAVILLLHVLALCLLKSRALPCPSLQRELVLVSGGAGLSGPGDAQRAQGTTG